jgi:hypothetical protein
MSLKSLKPLTSSHSMFRAAALQVIRAADPIGYRSCYLGGSEGFLCGSGIRCIFDRTDDAHDYTQRSTCSIDLKSA